MVVLSTEIVLEALDYAGSDGLITTASTEISPERIYIWNEIRDKFQIDAAYFHGDVPVIYFKGLQGAANDNDFVDWHCQLWNHGRVPLLVVVLPEEVRVYDCFALPKKEESEYLENDDSALLERVKLVTDIVQVRRELESYRREEVESGRLARANLGRFKRNERVNQRLLENLRHVRLSLIKSGLSEHIVNNLIGRSIFIRYLEGREILTRAFLQETFGAETYPDLLKQLTGSPKRCPA